MRERGTSILFLNCSQLAAKSWLFFAVILFDFILLRGKTQWVFPLRIKIVEKVSALKINKLNEIDVCSVDPIQTN